MEKTLLLIVLVPIIYGAYIIFREFNAPPPQVEATSTIKNSAGNHLIRAGVFIVVSALVPVVLYLVGLVDYRLITAASIVSGLMVVYNIIMAGVRLNEQK